MKKLSFGSWAFVSGPYVYEPVPFDKCVRRIAEAGYDAIEVCGVNGHVTLARYPAREPRAELKALLDEAGLACSGYLCDQYDCDPTEAANRDRYLEKFSRHLEMCQDLAIGHIRVDTVAPPEKYPDPGAREAALGQVAEVFRAAAEKAQEAGVRLDWEFEPRFLFHRPSEIARLHEAVGHPNFGILFDTSQAYLTAVAGARHLGEPETLPGGVGELLDKLEGKISAVHLGDSDGALRQDLGSTHCPFGTGRIDFPALAPKLLAIPDIEFFTIDMAYWAGAWELADAQLEYARRLLQAAGETAAAS